MTALGTSIPFILFPKIFKKHYNPATWTIGKALLNYLILIFVTGFLIITYDMIILPTIVIDHISGSLFPEGSLRVLFIDLFATLTISLIPITVITILTQNSALKQNLKEAILLNQALAKRIRSEHEDIELITLTGNTKESIKILPENLLYIEASGNYADVYYRENNETQHKLLRATIKQIEEQVSHHPILIRCHRAYIVNTNHILCVSGNTQGYKLTLQHVPKEIPVSRTYMENLKETII